MNYKLFLDDVRTMTDCVTYMHSRIGARNPIYLERDWVICRNYECFVNTIKHYGLPTFISFDHDLALEHYTPEIYWSDYEKSKSYQESVFPNYKEQTGYECAKWLVEWCQDHYLQIPEFAVHSMNPVGAERIFSLLTQAKNRLHDDREGIQSVGY